MTSRPMAERFWGNVDKSGDCWEWTGRRFRRGYGHFKFNGRDSYASRVAYILTHGPIPDDAVVCHSCDNPPCVNPAHLFAGSRSDNMRDKCSKKRHGNGKLGPSEALEIRRLHSEGAVGTELAARYGVSLSHISNIVRGFAWNAQASENRRLHRPANVSPRGYRKLDPDSAEQIRRLRDGGERVVDLASRYGVSRCHVYRVINGYKWSERAATAGGQRSEGAMI